MEIIIFVFGCLIIFSLWCIYKKIKEIGIALDIELQGLNHKIVTLLILLGEETKK